MSRYAEALTSTLAWLALEHRGWGAVIVPPTEQREIADYLASQLDGHQRFEVGEHGIALEHPGDATRLRRGIVTLSATIDDASRERAVAGLNQQRDFLADRGVWVLVVSASELALLRRRAPDLASVLRSIETIAFTPRTLSAGELRAARAQLRAYYQRRFGRLDLRGFIRSEHEDVSFAAEEIYQPLRGRGQGSEPFEVSPDDSDDDPDGDPVQLFFPERGKPLIDHLAAPPQQPLLLVGAPGSGKSFFLRWCALNASAQDRFAAIDNPTPVYVSLAAASLSTTLPGLLEGVLESLLSADLAIAHGIVSEAAEGRCLFLFDGLDEAGDARQAIARQLELLATRFPASRVVVTSRPTGLDGISFTARRIDLEDLDDDGIRELLTRWCELYEIQRSGVHAGPRGRTEGAQLADEVTRSPSLAALARSPLLCTIIAIVHRAGVRLPEHRVELYDHIVRILVERWNQLRSRDVDVPTPPIRVHDAIRLLGPVAYSMIESARDGAIDEASLRDLISRQVEKGTIRAVTDAAEAVAVFRNSLGLLVEQAPGAYSFLHKTLGEFLAAHEAVRTGTLGVLVREKTFSAAWREVVLLALGIVGTLQANDEWIHSAIEAIIRKAEEARTSATRTSALTENVPAFLAGVLADDPGLSPRLAAALCHELVPHWWFDRANAEHARVAQNLLQRLLRGSWRPEIGKQLLNSYGRGYTSRPQSSEDISRFTTIMLVLLRAGAPEGPLMCEWWTAVLASGIETHYLLRWSFDGPEIPCPDEGGMLRLPLEDASGFEPIIRHGGADLFRLHVYERDPLDGGSSIELERPRLDGHQLLLHTTFKKPWRVDIEFQQPRGTERRNELLAAVLSAWRELAAAYPLGPQPPSNIDAAIAKYETSDKAD